MRRMVITLLALGVFAASAASAATFWSETFSYANGGLVANSGGNWVGHSTSTSTTYIDIQVVNGEAVLIGANGQDDSRNFTARSASAATYACFQMKLTGTETSGSSYVTHFKNNSTGFVSQVFVFPTGATTFNIGINSTSAVPTGASIWPTPLTKGTFYTIAIRYNAATGVSTLWVDPQSESSASINSTTTTIGTLISGFALRQATGASTTFDNIQVGDAFADLCPAVVPTNSSTWGQLKSLYR